MCLLFFFFKQKTAYEMRISDWSSDVCSSDLDAFLRFRDAAAAAGIDAPILPGILPVSNVSQTRRMADMCGTAIPAWMVSLFDGLDDHPAARQLVSATIAAEMCRRLYAGGVRDFHFYTLNRAELSYAICHLLWLRPVSTAKIGRAHVST